MPEQIPLSPQTREALAEARSDNTGPSRGESVDGGELSRGRPAASLPPESEIPEYEIRPARGWVAIDWKELLHYRELLFFFVWRDIKVRYKQTVLGVAWSVLQPMVMMLISTVIFGVLFKFSENLPDELKARHIPYSLFAYAGVLPWIFFSTGVSQGSMSLLNQQNLLTKVYFPRIFVPVSVVGVSLVDALISIGLFMVMMLGYGIVPTASFLALPLLLLLTLFAAMGITIFLAAISVTYRDFRYVVPFMINLWQFVSPVNYPLPVHKAWLVWLVRLNPLDGIINGYRSALLGQQWDWAGLGIALLETIGMMALGLAYFKKTERRFADIA